MKVLVDTCIWSELLRRSRSESRSTHAAELLELIDESRVLMLGVVRQEVLSGIAHRDQYERLRNALREFEDTPVVSEDYERAAEFFNSMRARGVQGSNVDFFICAVASRVGCCIYTLDGDFAAFARYLPVRLHTPRA